MLYCARALPALLSLVVFLLALGASAPESARAADACDLVASSAGSDGADGSEATPFRSVQRLVDSLSAGQTGCVRKGDYTENVSFRRGGASSSAPLTLQSYPGERARIIGQVRILDSANFVSVRSLDLDGSGAPSCGSGETCTIRPSPVVYSDDVTFEDNDVTNRNTAICFVIGDSGLPSADRTVIAHNDIHACGRRPATNYDHGIYVENAESTRIERNLIHDNVNRGIQFYPRAMNSEVRGNVIDGNGQNVHFGEASSGNRVEGNVITNAVIGYNVQSWEATGSGNTVSGNCIANARYGGSPTASGIQAIQQGFTARDNVLADPGYVDRSAGDYRLRDGGACSSVLGSEPVGPRGNTSPPAPVRDPVSAPDSPPSDTGSSETGASSSDDGDSAGSDTGSSGSGSEDSTGGDATPVTSPPVGTSGAPVATAERRYRRCLRAARSTRRRSVRAASTKRARSYCLRVRRAALVAAPSNLRGL